MQQPAGSRRRVVFPLLVAAAALLLVAPRPGLSVDLPPCIDGDADGYFLCDAACDPTGVTCGDCDDASPAANPAASETCNHVDDDCDGLVDETSAKTWAQQLLVDPVAAPGDRFGATL